MSRNLKGVAAIAAVVCFAADRVVAELVLLGGAPTGSFVQFWTYNGVGPNTIDTAVIQFISQTAAGGGTTQTGWIGAEFHSGWDTPFSSETFALGTGPVGSPAFFDIHIEDPPTDIVTFRFWGYLNGTAVLGKEIVTSADPQYQAPAIVELNTASAPTLIPIPSGAAVGLAGLAGLATVMAMRRRALRA